MDDRPTGTGLVTFAKEGSMWDAVIGMDGKILNGEKLFVHEWRRRWDFGNGGGRSLPEGVWPSTNSGRPVVGEPAVAGSGQQLKFFFVAATGGSYVAGHRPPVVRRRGRRGTTGGQWPSTPQPPTNKKKNDPAHVPTEISKTCERESYFAGAEAGGEEISEKLQNSSRFLKSSSQGAVPNTYKTALAAGIEIFQPPELRQTDP
ncbi:hypothetical protein KSP40_PGU018275 [Platanthera guangdongensis]|uniref:Uncharacterized protein n=1 Tax=Platanthera guangdongensis TaxID=2320717 RepID=A0ABR2MK93_9ASPA